MDCQAWNSAVHFCIFKCLHFMGFVGMDFLRFHEANGPFNTGKINGYRVNSKS